MPTMQSADNIFFRTVILPIVLSTLALLAQIVIDRAKGFAKGDASYARWTGKLKGDQAAGSGWVLRIKGRIGLTPAEDPNNYADVKRMTGCSLSECNDPGVVGFELLPAQGLKGLPQLLGPFGGRLNMAAFSVMATVLVRGPRYRETFFTLSMLLVGLLVLNVGLNSEQAQVCPKFWVQRTLLAFWTLLFGFGALMAAFAMA